MKHPSDNPLRILVNGHVIIIFASVFASWACFRQLGGYDLSPVVDLFWRMKFRETAGVDFLNTLPPLFLLIAKLMSPFNIGWYELTLANIIVTFICYIAILAISKKSSRTFGWGVAIATILTLPLIYTNHIWHSSLSQLCAIPFFFSIYRNLEDGGHEHWGASIAVTSAFLILSKQNVALPLLTATIVFVVAMGDDRRWRFVALICGGSIAGLALCLAFLGMSLGDFVASYTAVLGRGVPRRDIFDQIVDLPSNRGVVAFTIAAIALVGLEIWRSRRAIPAHLRLAGLFAGLSLLPILTDWDMKLNDGPLPLFIAATVVLRWIQI